MEHNHMDLLKERNELVAQYRATGHLSLLIQINILNEKLGVNLDEGVETQKELTEKTPKECNCQSIYSSSIRTP